MTIEIPAEAAEALAAVRREHHHNAHIFEPWQDQLLRECWNDPHYIKEDVAKIVGVSTNTARARYRKLMEGNDEG